MKDNKNRVLIGLYVLCSVLSVYGITNSLFANIAASYPDVPLTTLQQIMTIPSLSSMVVSFIIGPLAMKFSKKLLLLISAGCEVCYFLIFIYIGSTGGPVGALLFAALLAGFCSGSAITLGATIIGENFPPEKSGTYVAIITSMLQCGAAIANIICGRIAAGNGGADWPKAYYLGLIVIPAMVVFAILMPSDKKVKTVSNGASEGANSGNTGKDKIPMRVFLLIGMKVLYGFCVGAYAFNMSIYVINEFQLGTSADTGIISTVQQMVGMSIGFGYGFISKILKRHVTTFAYSCVVIGILATIFLHDSLLGVYIAAVCIGISGTTSSASVMSQIMQETPAHLVPISNSLYMGVMSCAAYLSVYVNSFLGQFFGGGVLGQLKVGLIFGIGMVIMSIVLAPKPAKATQRNT